MAGSEKGAADWLSAARAGSQDALGQALQACRAYLLLVAERELDPQLHPKGGASDLVQETLMDAVRAFDRFQGNSEEELRRWLRRLLLNNLVSFARRYRDADKRQVGREIGLAGPNSSGDYGGGLAAAIPSPSGQAMEQEQAQLIQQALERLPDDYRLVILLRYQEERSFEDIGRMMELTPNAARKLWLRAVKRLQQESQEQPPQQDS
jgi:RNA polymerase sigma-70 factor (ECF subfamily)